MLYAFALFFHTHWLPIPPPSPSANDMHRFSRICLLYGAWAFALANAFKTFGIIKYLFYIEKLPGIRNCVCKKKNSKNMHTRSVSFSINQSPNFLAKYFLIFNEIDDVYGVCAKQDKTRLLFIIRLSDAYELYEKINSQVTCNLAICDQI